MKQSDQWLAKQRTKVGVILPSRGLIFSQTAEEIVTNVQGVRHKFFFAHKLPIPECFETPTRRALQDKTITHLWFVEDDMILPPDVLKSLVDADKESIACNYPINNQGRDAMLIDAEGRVVFSGTGCLLVKRAVFERMKKPYFRTDIGWQGHNYENFIKLISSKSRKDNRYGLHDVTFGVQLYKEGRPIIKSPILLGQRKLVALGQAGTNDGAHQIEEWTEVNENTIYNEIRSYPAKPVGSLVTVMINGIESPMMDAKHAAMLMEKKGATPPPKRSVIIDDSAELLWIS